MGGKKSSHAGWWYGFGIHMGIGRGPIDALKEIRVGDRRAWLGRVVSNGAIWIDAPNLFGGEDKEGGIQGALEVLFGEPTQTASAGLLQMLGAPVPGFRGMFTVFFDGWISANNPYPKPWKFRLSRILKGWDGSVFAPSLATLPIEGLTAVAETDLIRFGFTSMSAGNTGVGSVYLMGGVPTNSSAFSPEGVRLGLSRTQRWEDGYSSAIGEIRFTYDDGSGTTGFGSFERLVHEVEMTSFTYVADPLHPEHDNIPFSLYRILFTFADRYPITSAPTWVTVELLIRHYLYDGIFQFVFSVLVDTSLFHRVPLGNPAKLAARTVVDTEAGEISVYVNDHIIDTFAIPLAGGLLQPCQEVDIEEIGAPALSQAIVDSTEKVQQGDIRNFRLYGVRSDGLEAMNPAHIIYEALTNRDWGRGLPRAQMDDLEFLAAADRLYTEGFGLCARWTRKGVSIEEFVQSVLDHIGGALYENRKTGLMTLSLIRENYFGASGSSVPFFTPETGLLEVRGYTVSSPGRGVNAVTVEWHDQLEDQARTVTVKNVAAIQAAQGAVNSTQKSYPYIPSSILALRVAQRDLRAASTNLRRATVVIDGSATGADDVYPGSLIEIQDVNRAIPRMNMRVGSVEVGNDVDGQIVAEVVQDVFSLPTQSFATGTPKTWEPPSTAPCISTHRVFELPYFILAGRLSPADLTYVNADGGYMGTVAAKGKTTNTGIQLAVRSGSSTPDDAPTDTSYYCE